MGQLAPDWWMRGVTLSREEERPLSRAFSKRLEGRWSKERGGATGRGPALQKGGRGEFKDPFVLEDDVVRERKLLFEGFCSRVPA